MTEFFTEAEVLAAEPRLTPARLAGFVAARFVRPLRGGDQRVFRQVDLARIELLCDLHEGFALDDDALGLVMSLVDQLHEARKDLGTLLAALAEEPAETRARLAGRLDPGAA